MCQAADCFGDDCRTRCLLRQLRWATPLRLPGMMLHNQAQGKVSLHQHACVHLCDSTACSTLSPTGQYPALQALI
ncbi:hypothetical protein NFI96_033200 [Prochilodus magdalenae]|nr:hypothetical protein NFI96_033200 [Prochilodus magdalenae]